MTKQIMDMIFVDRRDIDLADGSVCVVVLQRGWNDLNMALAVYFSGRFYDQMVVEENELSMSAWDITDNVISYSFTGKTVEL